ncbi:MAG: response regulator [Chitinophagaceae bacterium]
MNKKKLLICDDDTDILEVLAMVFQPYFDVIAEPDSAMVMDLVRTHQPALIMVDLWMPVLSGDQLIRLLRLGAPGKNARIIAISASPTGQKISLDAGADLFIPKPFDIHSLIAEVCALSEWNALDKKEISGP